MIENIIISSFPFFNKISKRYSEQTDHAEAIVESLTMPK